MERYTKVASCLWLKAIYTSIRKRWTKRRCRKDLPFDACSVAHPPPCLSVVLSMEEGRSASRGNRGPCTPRGLHLSTKSSPMLSMLLSMEDDEPSCNSWSPTAMRVDHRHALHFCCLDCPSMSALCHEPWSQLFPIPSSPPSMLSLIAGSSSTNFSSTFKTEHVLNHCSIAKFLKLSFQRVVIHPNRTPNQRVTPFLLC